MRGMQSAHRLPTGQRENNVDRGVYIHRFAIEVVRLVPPLLDGIQRGAREHGVAADYVQVLDGAIFADQSLQHDGTLNASLAGDRKSTRLNFSHLGISYAGFCLKKNNI